jgi:O-antigen ligase
MRDLRAVGVQDVLLLVAVAGLPWIWGGVGMEAYRAASALVGLAVGWALLRDGWPGLGVSRTMRWLLPAVLLGAWGFLQATPLPRSWVGALSPKASALEREAFGAPGISGDAWLRGIEEAARLRVPEAAGGPSAPAGGPAPAADSPRPPRWFTLSLAPTATLERSFWYGALLLAFLLAHARVQSRSRASVYRAALFGTLVTLAAIGILNRLTAPTRLLWLRDAPTMTRPFGPYVNPDHFAGAMEIAVPWLLGYGLAAVGERPRAAGGRAGRVLALAGAGVGAVAAVLAASKFAVATIAAASVVLVVTALTVSRGRRRAALAGLSVVVAVLLAAVAVVGPLRERVADFQAVQSDGVSGSARVLAWRAGWAMASDYVLAGSGFGAFVDVFPEYMPHGEGDTWLQLHNDYLEAVVGGGLIAAALAAWLAAAYARRAGAALRRAAAEHRLLPSLGLLLGLAAIAVHELVDFNLQIPANALLFVVAAALAIAPLARASEGA